MPEMLAIEFVTLLDPNVHAVSRAVQTGEVSRD